MTTSDSDALVRQLAYQVAIELGPDWTPDENPEWAKHPFTFLNGPDGAQLQLTIPRLAPKRLTVRGVHPHRPEQGQRHSGQITIAWGRGARAIAAEITRRLLPGYLPALAESQARQAQLHASDERRKNVTTVILTLLPGTTVTEFDSSTTLYLRLPGDSSGKAQIDLAGTTLSLDLANLPVRTAWRILSILTDIQPASQSEPISDVPTSHDQ